MSGRAGEKLRRSLIGGLLSGLVLVVLLLSSAALAGGVPSLASTSQYKAFTAYVKKLNGLVGQPVTGAQKATFEAELTAKEKAAAHKANALFSRSGEKAQAESTAMAKEQTEAVRRGEEEELESLASETKAKLGRASASYQAKLGRLVTGHKNFEAGAHEHIAALRAKKAQAADTGQKNAIQEQITAIVSEIGAKRQEESTKRAELKKAFQPQKEQIQAAAATSETEIGEAAEAKVEVIAAHWKNVYNEKKATLNSKRESQLGYLGAKLEQGRTDIGAMPAAG